MTQDFQKFWLKITAIGIACFGPIFFLGTIPATSEPIRFSMDLLSWPIDGTTTWDHPDTRFLSALSGGFLMGWGVTIWCLQAYVYDHAPDAVRRAVVTGSVAWFIVDSAGSIASGNSVNAFFNLIIWLVLVGPLVVPTRKPIQGV